MDKYKDIRFNSMILGCSRALEDLDIKAKGFINEYVKCENDIYKKRLIKAASNDLLIDILSQRNNGLDISYDLRMNVLGCISQNEEKAKEIANSIEGVEELIIVFDSRCIYSYISKEDMIMNVVANEIVKKGKLEETLGIIRNVLTNEKLEVIKNRIDIIKIIRMLKNASRIKGNEE
ncbi:hypothetical protein OCOL_000473 [Ordospora colligata]